LGTYSSTGTVLASSSSMVVADICSMHMEVISHAKDNIQ
jgi:hypothetical protein